MSNETKKILVAGWIGSENTGDEAIFASLLSFLKTLPVKVTAFSINETKTRKEHRVSTAPFEIFSAPGRFLKTIRECDLMIVGGGGILQDQTSIFNTPRYLYKALLAKIFGKKVIFYAVGAGPINYGFTKKITKYVLNKSDAVLVRDENSKKILISIGVKKDLIKVTFDPAISLNPVNSSISKKIVAKEVGIHKDKKIIGISVRHWFDINPLVPVSVMKKFNWMQSDGKSKYNKFTTEVAGALNEINKNGEYVFLFIPYWYSRDTKVSRDVIKQLHKQDLARTLSKPYSSEEILGIFQQLDIAVAMRLHACIFSANVGVPFVALSYSSKVNNFLEEIRSPDLAVKIDDLNRKNLKEKISYVLRDENKIRKSFSSFVGEARKKEMINRNVLSSLINSI